MRSTTSSGLPPSACRCSDEDQLRQHMPVQILLIALAAAVGALARYGIGVAAGPQPYPSTTLGINVTLDRAGKQNTGCLESGRRRTERPRATRHIRALVGRILTYGRVRRRNDFVATWLPHPGPNARRCSRGASWTGEPSGPGAPRVPLGREWSPNWRRRHAAASPGEPQPTRSRKARERWVSSAVASGSYDGSELSAK